VFEVRQVRLNFFNAPGICVCHAAMLPARRGEVEAVVLGEGRAQSAKAAKGKVFYSGFRRGFRATRKVLANHTTTSKTLALRAGRICATLRATIRCRVTFQFQKIRHPPR
jgi:hypothetical protein